jgi:hypothetical protein
MAISFAQGLMWLLLAAVVYAALDDFATSIHQAILPPQVRQMTTPRWGYKQERACVDGGVDSDEQPSCEALERWLDDGGASDNEVMFNKKCVE